ncbi:Hypothetical protein R9X50_00541700 [Acrodontium crateriforme]|uniref:M protein repeat protein n=1 Tax=Acrodontium crateriforme TaxID=150365 RepID=A0AAQ3MCK2_9PEZI|nr:Hypothetical protein R9X50_00541700 [Acrodontium crateriforme]
MGDEEEKAKAEKLAAAKKRFEQLKKEQQKKNKKSVKKKGDKSASTATAADDKDVGDAGDVEDTADNVLRAEDEKAAGAEDDESSEKIDETNDKNDNDDAVAVEDEKDDTQTKQSESMRSKERSESFKKGSPTIATDLKSQTNPLSPSLEVQELYKKQAARIEELEKESRGLKEQKEEGASRLAKAEEELETLRESSSDIDGLKAKAKEADRLSTELESVQRQLSQAQHADKDSKRRVSTTSPDLTQQLATKTSTIESLELELSNLRNQLESLQTSIGERDAAVKDSEDRVKAAEAATETHKQELDALKVSMSFPSDDTKAANEDPEALTKRIGILESDLRTAQADAEAAAKRATSLEQKIEALTKLHRDATTASQTKDKELTDLRAQLKKRDRPSHVRDASEFELNEDETETGTLEARIRALEAENFELKRGIWRDKRAELQPGMHEDATQEYEDVDLNDPYSPAGRARLGSIPRQTSSFQEVISSGITAFTGRPRDAPSQGHARKQSLGLLSDDGGFDEEAFRLAQEEEAKRRIERIKEVKRGLENWKGWRVDIAEARQNVVGHGPVFEV